MYFDGIQQDETGFVSVDGGLILGGFFRKGAREQNEAMKSICSFVQVHPQRTTRNWVEEEIVNMQFSSTALLPPSSCCNEDGDSSAVQEEEIGVLSLMYDAVLDYD